MPGTVTLYNRQTKEKVEMFAVQARDALRNHPDEWTQTPVAGAIQKRAVAQTIEPGTGALIPAGERVKSKAVELGGESGAPKAQGPRASSREQQLRGPVDLTSGEGDGEFDDGPDDFTQIKGMGPATVEKLNSLGVTTFEQIRDMTPARIAEVEAKLGTGQNGAFARNNWVAEARRLSGD